jgi:hypothetical protein
MDGLKEEVNAQIMPQPFAQSIGYVLIGVIYLYLALMD